MDNNFNQQQDNFNTDVQQNVNNSQQQKNTNNNPQDKGKTSMICGILSIVLCFIGWFCCIGYAGVPLAIIAIVFAIQTKNNNGGVMSNEAKTGLITGIIGLVVLALGFIVGLVLGVAVGLSGM